MRFFVTGTPRSATRYASELLNECGVRCAHEQIGKPRVALLDVLEWYDKGLSGDSSWLAWTVLGCLPGPVPVLHTTRDPWRVIDSLAHRNDILPRQADLKRHRKPMRDCVGYYCPKVLEYNAGINRAAAMFVQWNGLIEAAVRRHECPYMRYHAEDLDADGLDKIMEFLGTYRDSVELARAAEGVSRSVNAGRHIEYEVPVGDASPLMEAIKSIPGSRNPTVQSIVDKAKAGEAISIGRGSSKDTPRTPDELEAGMDPRLCDEVNALAEKYGYARDNWAATEIKKERANDTCNQSAAV